MAGGPGRPPGKSTPPCGGGPHPRDPQLSPPPAPKTQSSFSPLCPVVLSDSKGSLPAMQGVSLQLPRVVGRSITNSGRTLNKPSQQRMHRQAQRPPSGHNVRREGTADEGSDHEHDTQGSSASSLSWGKRMKRHNSAWDGRALADQTVLASMTPHLVDRQRAGGSSSRAAAAGGHHSSLAHMQCSGRRCGLKALFLAARAARGVVAGRPEEGVAVGELVGA